MVVGTVLMVPWCPQNGGKFRDLGLLLRPLTRLGVGPQQKPLFWPLLHFSCIEWKNQKTWLPGAFLWLQNGTSLAKIRHVCEMLSSSRAKICTDLLKAPSAVALKWAADGLADGFG